MIPLEFSSDFRKILHVRAAQHRDAEGGRLEDVVSAAMGEGAAHEDGRGDAEERVELADGVEQEDAWQGDPGGRVQFRPAQEGDAAGGELFGGEGKAVRAAGGEDQQQAREALCQALERIKDDLVFVGIVREHRGHGGGGDPDRFRAESVQEGGYIWRNFRGIRVKIVLEIPGNFHIFRAEGLVAFRGRSILGEDAVRLRERVPEKPAEAKVARQGAVRDAGVGEQEARAGTAGFAEQIGPDLGLHDNDKSRTEAPQHAAHGEAIIQRRIEDTIGEPGELFLAESAPGKGRCGNVDWNAGQERTEAAEQDRGGDRLADADGMQPDGSGCRRENVRRQEAEALAEAAQVAAVFGDPEGQVQ